MAHRRISGVHNFIVHAEQEDVLKVLFHLLTQGGMVFEVYMLDLAAVAGIFIGCDVRSADNAHAILIKQRALVFHELRIQMVVQMFDDIH